MFDTVDDFGADLTPDTGDEPGLPAGDFSERMDYDVRGRQSLHISFEGIVTEYVYDDATNGTGRLIQKKFYADEGAYNAGTVSETQTMNYDAFGREVSTVWDRDAANPGTTVDTWTNEYDQQGRLLRVESPTGDINYTYDEFGRQKSVIPGSSGSYTGDLANPSTHIEYSYDVLGRLSKVEALEKNDVTVDVDPNTAGDQPETESYAYTLNGSLDYEVNPDGSVTDYTYDDLNRLTDIDEYRANTTTPDDFTDNPKLSEYSYTLRDDGKRDSADDIIYDTDGTTKLSHTQFDWTYDDAGRLTDEVFTDVGDLLADAENYKTSFEYDLTGNRLKKTTITDDDGTAGFDATTDTDEVITYGQDVNDRMTSEDRVVDGIAVDSTAYGYTGTQQTSKTVTDAANTVSSVVNYSYDLQGRLADVQSYQGTNSNPSSIISYRYGTDGIRISSTTHTDSNANGTVDSIEKTEYLVDARNHTGYQQVLEETVYDVDPTTGAETESKKIVYTIGHDHISQTTFEPGGPTQGETLVFHMDGHGSTRILTDLAGVVATVGAASQIYHYTAYGNAINFQMANAATQYLYSGEQFDARIGQQYLRARYYNQANGTFNRLDPFFGNTTDPQSFHKYLYTHGDPVNGVDPTGEFLISIAVGLGVRSHLRSGNKAAVFGASAAILGTLAFETFFDPVQSAMQALFGWTYLAPSPDRSLTNDEKKVLHSIHTATRPGLSSSQIQSRLDDVRLWQVKPLYDPRTLSPLGYFSPQLWLRGVNLTFTSTAGITLGNDIHFAQDPRIDIDAEWLGGTIGTTALLAHETVHSMQQEESPLGRVTFYPGYVGQAIRRWTYKNLDAEVEAYAMSVAIHTISKKYPTFRSDIASGAEPAGFKTDLKKKYDNNVAAHKKRRGF